MVGAISTDGIVIQVLANFINVKAIITFLRNRNNPRFNIKVSREFSTITFSPVKMILKSNLCICAH